MCGTRYPLLLLTLIVCWRAEFTDADTRKNVLLLFGDDAGFQMGAYKDPVIKSPHFDALAARSVVFRHGYTSVSSCSPSRSVLLTGQPQHQNGMYGLAHGPHHFSSMDDVKSLPNILAQHNVRTGIIGKYHVNPLPVYHFEFDYSTSNKKNNINQVGRNITHMRQLVRQFLQGSKNDTRPFFLYLAWHDPHRCGNVAMGQFCEKFGNGQPGFGTIPDWTPQYYNPDDIQMPFYLPNTPAARQDMANMYTTYSRMDQGLGLFMKELEDAGFADDTLVLYTSDNGIPFPGAKTNLYEPGNGEPMMISSPLHKQQWGTYTDALASTMDFTPTLLDWFGLDPGESNVKLTGKSLLPLTSDPQNVTAYDKVFSSHDFHEVTMNYPMRVVRTEKFRLIHNLNFKSPYGMATDIYGSPTFLEILNRTEHGQPTHWFKTLDQYYYRPQWELFDLTADPQELHNLADDPGHQGVLNALRADLFAWQTQTADPWRCLPGGELMAPGACLPLDNGVGGRREYTASMYDGKYQFESLP